MQGCGRFRLSVGYSYPLLSLSFPVCTTKGCFPNSGPWLWFWDTPELWYSGC